MASKMFKITKENNEVMENLMFVKVLRTTAKIRHFELMLNSENQRFYECSVNDYVRVTFYDGKADAHIIVTYGDYAIYYLDTKTGILYEGEYDNELRV